MDTVLVNMRPTRRFKDDTLFAFHIFGKEVPHEKLASNPGEVADLFQKVTGRTDLVYGDLEWFSEFRPNVRMVNKFGEGRVFVAGGPSALNSYIAKGLADCSI